MAGLGRFSGRQAAALAAASCVLLAPAAAQAAPSQGTVTGFSNSGDRLVVSAADDSVRHEISVARSVTATTDTIQVTDSAGIVAPPIAPCRQVSSTTIVCNRITATGPPGQPFVNRAIVAVEISGGDASDRIDLTAFGDSPGMSLEAGGNEGNDSISGSDSFEGLFGGPGRDRLDGGGGDDRLGGQGGADRLTGGAGIDQLRGGRGIDKLFARDGERDDAISCGGGEDRQERARVDGPDPNARSC